MFLSHLTLGAGKGHLCQPSVPNDAVRLRASGRACGPEASSPRAGCRPGSQRAEEARDADPGGYHRYDASHFLLIRGAVSDQAYVVLGSD